MSFLVAAMLTVVVDLSDQKMDVYSDWKQVASYQVSTGKRRLETPTGEYTVYLKKKLHLSKKYNMARMPYSLFFIGGYAIHAGTVPKPSRPASHGCVRLNMKDAKELYQLAVKAPTDVVVRP